jgi:hypothetical protein
MKKILFVFLSIFLIVTCKSQKTVRDKASDESSEIIISKPKIIFTLRTTACYGTCPGQYHVNVQGQVSKKLKKGTVVALREQFMAADFFEFKNVYEKPITDLPTTYISFTYQEKTKEIKDYVGSPSTLKELETLIKKLVSEEVEIKH